LPKSFTLYSQTTKSVDKFYDIKNELIRRGYDVKANDTICRQVSNRYEDLGGFAKQYDKVVFVSGKKSSNGRVLYDVCKAANPNSYFVSDPNELEKSLFQDNDTIGICGATSTPMWLMKQVKEALEAL
jgi:4-hydroxy-3-methylbut-2-enyl diphosphate reductase